MPIQSKGSHCAVKTRRDQKNNSRHKQNKQVVSAQKGIQLLDLQRDTVHKSLN